MKSMKKYSIYQFLLVVFVLPRRFGIPLMTLLTILSQEVFAYRTNMDTGDLVGTNHYRLQLETQFITNNDTGANLISKFDTHLSEDADVRALVGVGTTDVHVGGLLKWVPIPDTDTQPAIGLVGGLLFAHYEGKSEVSLLGTPLVSKGFNVSFGQVTPFASLPLSLKSYGSDTDITLQLAVGLEAKFTNLSGFRFRSEAGFDLANSFSHITVGAAYDYDPEIRFNAE